MGSSLTSRAYIGSMNFRFVTGGLCGFIQAPEWGELVHGIREWPGKTPAKKLSVYARHLFNYKVLAHRSSIITPLAVPGDLNEKRV